jgi:addiction module HigA family antidote
MTANKLLRGLEPIHPGELLREITLPAVAMPKTEVARLLGISRQMLYDILAERKPVTPSTAVRLGKLFGNGPQFWINLQTNYDLAQAEKKLAREVARIPTIKAA